MLFKKKWPKGSLIVLFTSLILVVLGLYMLAKPNAGWSGNIQSLQPSNSLGNLIKGQNWNNFEGAQPTAAGIKVTGLGRAIVNQDGSPGQSNPPVNVRGPHLETVDSFAITAKMSVPKGGSSSLDLYGAVPIIYDEWRYETPQLRLNVYTDKISIAEWDGSHDASVYQQSWTKNIGVNAQISIISDNNNLTLYVNNSLLGKIPSHSIFSSSKVWFGADGSIGSTWLLSYLNAQPVNGGKVDIRQASPLKNQSSDNKSLKTLSNSNKRNLPIGAAVAGYALFSDKSYQDLVAKQVSMITPENEMKPQFIHPQPNVYSFKDADSLVEFAIANGLQIHGHTLEFSEANPSWMQTLPLNQRQNALTNHINTVVSHFGNKINEWDVVDEPLNDNDDDNGDSTDLRQNIWFAAMGESYIDTAFKAAHQANPNAQLYINEYGLEADGSRWDEFLSLIKRLQQRGVPINGVGFQAHVHEQGDEVDTATLENHMNILASMGLKSRISEIDVYGDDAQHQADQYSAVLKACLDAKGCTSFTMWGVTDKYGSTTDIHNYPLSYGNDLVWDEYLQPKIAYKSLQNTLK